MNDCHAMNTAVAEVQDQTPAPTTDMAAMIERLVMSPDIDVGKLEQLLAMQERIMARQAAQQYAGAMTAAQEAMSVVSQDAANPQTRSKYASFAALDKAIRPIYSRHGFSLSFDTDDSPKPDHVRVVCDVLHSGGHIARRHIDMPADGKGAKGGSVMTATHATMSAVSYGRRALLKMIFNIAEGKEDDDGNAAGASADDFLSADQIKELRAGLKDGDEAKLLAFISRADAQIEKLDDIYANKFTVLKQIVNERRWEKTQ